MFAAGIASSLKEAERPLVVSGHKLREPVRAPGGGERGPRPARARGRKRPSAWRWPNATASAWGSWAEKHLDDAFAEVEGGTGHGNNPRKRPLPARGDGAKVDQFLRSLRHTAVIDHLFNPMAQRADMVLPAATFAEGEGTFVNNEGRAQRYFQVFPAGGQVQAAWRWVGGDIPCARRPREEAMGWERVDDVAASMARTLPWGAHGRGGRGAAGGLSESPGCGSPASTLGQAEGPPYTRTGPCTSRPRPPTWMRLSRFPWRDTTASRRPP